MARTIAVVGFGPGVSRAVAERFGAEGFAVALLGRTQATLDAGVEALKAKGMEAAAFVADANHPMAVRQALADAKAALGPIAIIHWNAFSREAGDLLTAEPVVVTRDLDVAVVSLLAAVQEALPDLKAAGDGAVLVTNGAFGDLGPAMDGFAVSLKAMGLAVANAAKHKLVGLLSARLKDEGVYVGEVMIAGAVRGTPTGAAGGTIEAAAVAGQFFDLWKARGEIYARAS